MTGQLLEVASVAADADWHDDERDRDDRDYDYDEEPHGSAPRLSCNREVVGQVLGGIAGGVAGAQLVAVPDDVQRRSQARSWA